MVSTSLGLVLLLAALVEPYMPSITTKARSHSTLEGAVGGEHRL